MRAALAIIAVLALTAFLPHGQQSSGSFPVPAPSAYTGQCSSEADLLAMPSNTFCEVPGTDARQVAPVPAVTGTPPLVLDFSYIMRAYSGAAFDYVDNRMFIVGGGHGNYAGNEVPMFDVPTLSWSLIWGPSANADIPTELVNYDSYLDGTAGSKHTYDGLFYDATNNALYSFGGSMWRFGGGSTSAWELDLDTSTWTNRATLNASGSGAGRRAEYIAPLDKVLVIGQGNYVQLYDPSDHSLTTGTGSTVPQDGGDQKSFTWDENDAVGVYVGSNELHHWTYSGSAWTKTTITDPNVPIDNSTNCSAIISPPSGVGGQLSTSGEYISSLGDVVFYVGSGDTSLWRYDPTTRTCTEIPVSASNLYTPPGPGTYQTNGLYGRFRCIKSGTLTNYCLFVEGVDNNVVFYKL